jgi:uncharacterized membrane protein YciS (DUF1049 family)
MAGLRRLVGIALFVGLVVATVMLRDANSQPIEINYMFGALGDVPLWGVVAASFGLGAVAMGLVLSARLARGSLSQRRYRRVVAGLEAEVHQLRNLPVAEPGPSAPAQIAAVSGDGGA